MKTILFANNYDMSKSRESFEKGNSPAHHQFGTSELIETGEYQIDYILISPKNYQNKILKLLSLFPLWFKLYRKAKKYDIVYGGADFTVDFLGVVKKFGLFRPKLVSIFHHPPFSARLKIEKFDRIIFLSSFACDEMSRYFPKKASQMFFMQWGPDLCFYQKWAPILNYQKQHPELVFISNGKTRRDHDILVKAAEHSQNQTIIVCDKQSIPSNYNDQCTYTKLYYQEHPNDPKMVQLLNQCSVLVVPLPPTLHRLGPIGLTSLLDAMALGMPVITADNSIFTDIVEKNKLGFVYRAGDLDSLEQAMNQFKEKPELIIEFGKNARKFGENYDSKHFGEQLYQLLK